jgi:GTP-binding protein
MMCDPRLGLTELDDILLDVIRPRVQDGLKLLVLLTKSDKLTRVEGQKILSITRLQAGGGEVKLFSALKKQGIDEVAQLLWAWARLPMPRVIAPAEDSNLPGGAEPDDDERPSQDTH